jgi:hypothetical protein
MSFLQKRFPALDKSIDRFGYWWAVFGPGGILTVLGGWVANGIKPISDLGWGAVVFVGLGAACILMLVASALLVAYRYFNPLSQVDKSDAAKLPDQDSLAEMWQKITDVNKTMAHLFLDSDASLKKAATGLDGQIAAVNARIDAATNSLRQENSNLAGKVFALKTFHELRRLQRDIDRLVTLLERPLKQPKELRDWNAWSNRFKKYSRAIQSFSILATFYYPREAAALTYIDPSVYRISSNDFAPENFPNPETAHDFKTFRQLRAAYEGLAKGLMEGIEAKT